MYTISNFMFTLYQFQSQVHRCFCIFPFYWEPLQKQYQTSEKLRTRFNRECGYVFLYCFYLFTQAVLADTMSGVTFLNINLVFVLIASVQYCLLPGRLEDYLAFINGIVPFVDGIAERFRPSYNPNASGVNRFWDALKAMLLGLTMLFASIFTAHYWFYPTDKTYPIWNLLTWPPVTLRDYSIYLGYSVVNSYLLGKTLFSLTFMGEVFLHAIFAFSEIIVRELHIPERVEHPPWEYKTIRDFRRQENIFIYFRALQLMLRRFQLSLGVLLPINHYLMMLLTVHCQLSLLLQWEQLGRLTRTILGISCITVTVIWMGILDVFGRMMAGSKRMVASWGRGSHGPWNSSKEDKIMKKFIKSCPVLTIDAGVFVLRRTTVLRFAETVCRITFRAFVTVGAFGQRGH